MGCWSSVSRAHPFSEIPIPAENVSLIKLSMFHLHNPLRRRTQSNISIRIIFSFFLWDRESEKTEMRNFHFNYNFPCCWRIFYLSVLKQEQKLFHLNKTFVQNTHEKSIASCSLNFFDFLRWNEFLSLSIFLQKKLMFFFFQIYKQWLLRIPSCCTFDTVFDTECWEKFFFYLNLFC